MGFALLLPYNTQVYLDDQWWRPLHYNKDRLKEPDLAHSLQRWRMRRPRQHPRVRAVQRACRLSAAISIKTPSRCYCQSGAAEGRADLACRPGELYWRLGNPVQGQYGDYTFLANGAWSQGVAGIEALQILDGMDLKSIGHNSPQHMHTVTQAIELVMTDREAYVADPQFIEVQLETLTSKAFPEARRAAMTGHAFGQLPAPGTIQRAALQNTNVLYAAEQPLSTEQLLAQARFGKGTTHLAIFDHWGQRCLPDAE